MNLFALALAFVLTLALGYGVLNHLIPMWSRTNRKMRLALGVATTLDVLAILTLVYLAIK